MTCNLVHAGAHRLFHMEYKKGNHPNETRTHVQDREYTSCKKKKKKKTGRGGGRLVCVCSFQDSTRTIKSCQHASRAGSVCQLSYEVCRTLKKSLTCRSSDGTAIVRVPLQYDPLECGAPIKVLSKAAATSSMICYDDINLLH